MKLWDPMDPKHPSATEYAYDRLKHAEERLAIWERLEQLVRRRRARWTTRVRQYRTRLGLPIAQPEEPVSG